MALTDGLVAFWSLEEASGTRNDAHAANHLTDNNTVTQNTGKVGNCAQFTSANSEYLHITDNAAVSMGDIDFTIQAWVYFDSSAFFSIAGKWGATQGTHKEYALLYTGSAWRLNVGDGSATNTIDTAAGASTATWYHVIAYHDATNNVIGIVINNGTPETTIHTTGVLDGAGRLTIGGLDLDDGGTTDLLMNGRIDQIGIWKRMLDSTERGQLYNSGNGLAYSAMGAGGIGEGTLALAGTASFIGRAILMPDEI